MLTFVGLGLYDEKDITVKGLEAIRAADVVYAEFYTSPLGGKRVEQMEEVYGRKIVLLQRSDIEEHAEKVILEHAKNQNVVLLCGGDAMIATTHLDLRLRAIDRGIETRIIHAPSISSAVAGLCGLQNYKFGKSATRSPLLTKKLYQKCHTRRLERTQSVDCIPCSILISRCVSTKR